MKLSELLVPTLRETPQEAECISHILSIRAGFIRRVASGVYIYLPLGKMVLENIASIVREEMNASGAQEILMTVLQPKELWEQSGRWALYGPEMMRLKDRSSREFGLGPTHEEMVTFLMMMNARSYRDLPATLYQIQVKFRDEIRPRYGLLRAREFLMKDAYSFDRDDEGMKRSYWAIYGAYERIISRCGCDFMAVLASTGLIGGELSHEFVIPAEIGESSVVRCENCGYAANDDMAEYAADYEQIEGGEKAEYIETPEKSAVEDVAEYLGVGNEQIVKCMMYLVEGKPFAVLVSGERTVSDVKLEKVLKTSKFRLFEDEDWERNPHLIKGYVGPVGLDNAEIICDVKIKGFSGRICGANKEGFHVRNINDGERFTCSIYEDISYARNNDACAECGSIMRLEKGIEVGHVFQLGDKYSNSMKALFSDEKGDEKPYVMGCYGIGISRLMAAVIEHSHDERGIIWPPSIAPFLVHIIPIKYTEDDIRSASEELYLGLARKGIPILLDDRQESAGVKFADADLIGVPLRIVVGKGLKEKGLVELAARDGSMKRELAVQDAIALSVEKCASWMKSRPYKPFVNKG